MKKGLYILLVSSILATSCGGDDAPTPTHEVGTWELDSYQFINLPPGFSRNEGAAFAINQLSFGGIVFEDYTIILNLDGTFDREIGVTGPDVDDSGTWTLEDDILNLESDTGGVQDWEVQKNEDDDLHLSVESSFLFIPDIYFDTVTQTYLDYLDTLTDAQLDSVESAIDEVVVMDLVYVFERQ